MRRNAGRVGTLVFFVEEAVAVAVGIDVGLRGRQGLGLLAQERELDAREYLKVRRARVLTSLGGADDVANLEARADPAVEERLHTTAVVERGVDVVAQDEDVRAHAHGTTTHQEERGDGVERQLRHGVGPEAVDEREVVGDAANPGRVGGELALDAEHPQREVAEAKADVGRDRPQRFLRTRPGVVEVVLGVGEEEPAVDTERQHVPLGTPALDPRLVRPHVASLFELLALRLLTRLEVGLAFGSADTDRGLAFGRRPLGCSSIGSEQAEAQTDADGDGGTHHLDPGSIAP